MNKRRGFKNVEKQGFKVIKLHEEELDKILRYDLGLHKVRKHTGRKGQNWMFCCPWHGERRPSCGVVLMDDSSVVGQCYTCEETFSLPKLYAHVKNMEISEAVEELEENYRSEIRTEIFGRNKIKRYEDIEQENNTSRRVDLPRIKLAPYRSGKETHQYFYDRGFDDKDVEENLIGWDRTRKRVTIPLFHDDGVLAGFSGRAVLEQKLPSGKLSKKYQEVYGNEPKYYLYDNVAIGRLLYGSHDFPKGETDTAIIVEGLLDRIWMKKLGFSNALACIIAKMSRNRDGSSYQKDILHRLGVKKVIFMHDNDEAGRVGKEIAYSILKDDFICYNVEYPDGYNDVLGDSELPPLTKQQVDTMLRNAKPYGKKKLRRYEG